MDTLIDCVIVAWYLIGIAGLFAAGNLLLAIRRDDRQRLKYSFELSCVIAHLAIDLGEYKHAQMELDIARKCCRAKHMDAGVYSYYLGLRELLRLIILGSRSK
jgi:hypothetical protein